MKEFENLFSDRKYYDEHAEWLAEHVDDFFDQSLVTVFHEIVTFDVHVDVYLIQPKNTSFNILLTSGMSTFKMKVSEQDEKSEDLEFAELMMLVPKEIKFEDVYTGENKNDWIITVLKRTAKFPYYHDTWIGIGHSIQAEKDLSTYGKDTKYVGALILPSVTFDEKFTKINRDGRIINIYNILPLYKEELKFKIENGYNKFLDLLIKANGKEVLDLKRKNLILKKSILSRIFKQ